MKVKVYCRVAQHWRWRKGSKVETTLAYNGRPLELPDGQPVYTAHFVLNLEIPDAMLRPGALPEIPVVVDPQWSEALTPVVAQREDRETTTPEDAAAFEERRADIETRRVGGTRMAVDEVPSPDEL